MLWVEFNLKKVICSYGRSCINEIDSCLHGTVWSILLNSSCLNYFLPWLSALPEIPNSWLLFISNAAYAGCCSCLVTQLCPTLYKTMDDSPPGSSVHGILQAGILKWVAILFFSRVSSWHRGQTHISSGSWISDGFFTTETLFPTLAFHAAGVTQQQTSID